MQTKTKLQHHHRRQAPLVDAILQRRKQLLIIACKLETGDARIIREAAELLVCLRSLVADRTPDEIHRAFGAPGDFGYETPIGNALAIVYGVRS